MCFVHFQDSLQGYKSQNKFLNKEILELTVLRRNAESREKALEAKVLSFVCCIAPNRNRKSEKLLGDILWSEKMNNNAKPLLFPLLQYTALEAKLCQVESKYLVLLQEVKTPVCSSSEQSPAREVISRLLEDALQAESLGHQEHPIFKPNTVRYGLC